MIIFSTNVLPGTSKRRRKTLLKYFLIQTTLLVECTKYSIYQSMGKTTKKFVLNKEILFDHIAMHKILWLIYN